MAVQQDWRDEFLDSIRHISAANNKCKINSGPNGCLSAPDLHKITEGLFLSAWTHWEEFLRYLFELDLSTSVDGALRKEVRKFRTKGAPYRLSELILNHPDHPDKFVDWSDISDVVKRADKFLPPGHRFGQLSSLQADFQILKRIRNGIAHKSDRAWKSFKSLVRAAPFNLIPGQMKGITPGRFLSSHDWTSGSRVMMTSLQKLENAARLLVT